MVSTSVQQTVVSGQVSSILLEVFLYGIYAAVYAGTMYIYVSRKSKQNYYVLASITSLFLLNGLKTLCKWATVIEIVTFDSGKNTLATSYLYIEYDASLWGSINLVCSYPITLIADGLMIWRCYKVWGDSFRVISLLLFLILAEAALYIATVVVTFSPNSLLPASHKIFVRVEAGGLLLAFATTVLSAFLIFYRIHSFSRENGLKNSGRARYTRILYILTESSAIYVLGLLVYTIPATVPLTDINMVWLTGWASYSDPIFSFTSGMAPTLMVLCIALATDGDAYAASSGYISTLKFHVQSTHVHLSQNVSEV